jgi:hypothetical protein
MLAKSDILLYELKDCGNTTSGCEYPATGHEGQAIVTGLNTTLEISLGVWGCGTAPVGLVSWMNFAYAGVVIQRREFTPFPRYQYSFACYAVFIGNCPAGIIDAVLVEIPICLSSSERGRKAHYRYDEHQYSK